MSDRRNNGRVRKRITLAFGAAGDVSRRAFTEDMSPTGLFIKTANVSVPNTVLTVELYADSGTVRFDGRVMWAKRVPQNLFHLVKKSGMGVRIIRFHEGQELYQQMVA